MPIHVLYIVHSRIFQIEYFFSVVTDNEISETLNDSEIEFSGDDSDDDPEYSPPELNPTVNDESDSSSDDEACISNTVVSCPAFSDNSEAFASSSSLPSRPRGHLRSMSRSRSRVRSRGRGFSNTRSAPSLRTQALSF